MNLFIDLILRRIIVRVLGLYTRYFFFYTIGKKKTIKYLSGNTKELSTSLSQDFKNAIVGTISFVFLSIGIAYIVWG